MPNWLLLSRQKSVKYWDDAGSITEEVVDMDYKQVSFEEWKWLNESRMMETNGEIAIAAPPRT